MPEGAKKKGKYSIRFKWLCVCVWFNVWRLLFFNEKGETVRGNIIAKKLRRHP